MDDYARVIAETPVELVGTDVDGVNAGGSGLEKAIGESTGGGAEIGSDEVCDGDMKVLEGGFEFQAASPDKTKFRSQFDARVFGDELSGLGCLLAIYENFTGHDLSLCFFAGFGKTTVHHRAIQA